MEDARIRELIARIEALEARVKLLEDRRKPFAAPTENEVIEQAVMKAMGIWPTSTAQLVAKQFFDYYCANGWYVGKVRMKDWKAALRKWMNTEHQKIKSKPSQANERTSTAEYLAQRIAGINNQTSSQE